MTRVGIIHARTEPYVNPIRQRSSATAPNIITEDFAKVCCIWWYTQIYISKM